jgi:pantetheine-phosphate adenylyltransferase
MKKREDQNRGAPGAQGHCGDERPFPVSLSRGPSGTRRCLHRERARLTTVPVGLYAGSFDPIHLGHLGVIERASKTYDSVVVGVLANPDKPRGMFRPGERVRLVEEATRHLDNVSCHHFYGLTVDLARSVGATVLIRAAHKELHMELLMAAMNLRLAGIRTVMVPASTQTRMISSSVVRQLVASGQLGAAQDLVPARVALALAASRPAPTL